MASRLMALWDWFDARMPSVAEEFRKHMAEYYAPKNFNFWYFFGALSILVLVIQIVSGIFLTMNYKPDANLAFGSVEYIMRDVPGGPQDAGGVRVEREDDRRPARRARPPDRDRDERLVPAVDAVEVAEREDAGPQGRRRLGGVGPTMHGDHSTNSPGRTRRGCAR